ncbi:MAG: hypothetical protein IPN60_02395 [Saprospiraceae bacterium]|nr:hypothetical protein [Candidatus Opimibacter skivensis]MBL0008176.1 hypothetical protein [Candidatus Opimibacter skivensis]
MFSKIPFSNISKDTGKRLANCRPDTTYPDTPLISFYLVSSCRHPSPEDLVATYKSRIYLMSNTPHVSPLIQNFMLPSQPTIQSIQ